MGIQLLVSTRAYREKFIMEDFIGSDDIFALVGEGSFVFESVHGSYTVRENEGALFRRNVLYHRHVTEPVELYLFRYKSDKPLFDCDKVVFADEARIRSSIEMLSQVERGLLKNEFELKKHLFSDIVFQYALENEKPVGGGSPDPIVEKAISEIKESFNKKLSLAVIAEKTGLSYVQFLRRFKAYTGVSPSDYLNTLRVQKSKNMLGDPRLAVKDISAACGFENEYYFSNFFKKQTGMSPSAFRKIIT